MERAFVLKYGERVQGKWNRSDSDALMWAFNSIEEYGDI